MEEVFKASFDDSEILQRLENLEKQILKVGRDIDTVGDTASSSLNQAAGAAENFTKSMDVAAQQTARQAKAVTDARAANQSWLQSLRQTIAGQQLGGKTLGEWAEQARGFAAQITNGAGATGRFSGAWKIFSNILKATGIGLIVTAVASLINYFSKFQPLLDKVSQLTAGFSAALNVVAERIIMLGSAFGKLFSGDFSGAWDTASEAVTGFGSALADAAIQAANLEARLQALRDVTITQSVEASRQRVEIERLRSAVDDGTKSINERAAAARRAGELETQLARQAVDRALEAQQIAQEKFLLDKNSLAAREEAAQAEIAFQEAVINLNKTVSDAEKEQREFRREAAEERKKQLDAESKALEKILKDLDTLRAAAQPEGIERDLAEVEKKYNDLQRVAAEGVAALRKIEARRGLTPEELGQLEELAKIQVELEERRLSALLDVVSTYAEKDLEIEAQLAASKDALRKKDYELAVKGLENAKALQEQEIAVNEQNFANFIKVLEEAGVSEEQIQKKREELAKAIQTARLENELQFQKQLLEIAKAGDAESVTQIENTIRLIESKLAGVGIEGEQRKTLLERLGFTAEEIEGLKTATAQVIDSLSQIAEARVKEAEAASRAAQERVQAAEAALEREQELAAEGLANNTDLARQELERQKELRDEALKEEAKARRSQILLDSVSQISSLITASANIFKSLSGLGPFGIAAAIATIATMFGAFAKAKADALKSASVPKFRKGTKLDGRSHEEGGLAISDEYGNVVGEAEGGEWLIGTKPSREHDAFLQRLNRGEFAGVDLNRLVPRPTESNPLSESARRIEQVEQQRREMQGSQHFAAMVAAYKESASDIVQAIKQKPDIYPTPDGYIEATTKGRTRVKNRVRFKE